MVKFEEMTDDDDEDESESESDKHLEARDRRFLCLMTKKIQVLEFVLEVEPVHMQCSCHDNR